MIVVRPYLSYITLSLLGGAVDASCGLDVDTPTAGRGGGGGGGGGGSERERHGETEGRDGTGRDEKEGAGVSQVSVGAAVLELGLVLTVSPALPVRHTAAHTGPTRARRGVDSKGTTLLRKADMCRPLKN